MADIISDGTTKVTWMLTCATQSAPTAAECTAGVSLEAFITPDGLQINTTDAMVDTGSLASTQDSELPGRRKDTVTITFKDQGESAAPFSTFASRPAGFIVVRRNVAVATAYSAGQTVFLYPAKAGSRQVGVAAANEVSKFTVQFGVTGPVQESVALG